MVLINQKTIHVVVIQITKDENDKKGEGIVEGFWQKQANITAIELWIKCKPSIKSETIFGIRKIHLQLSNIIQWR